MSILEQCISYDNGNLKRDSIANLLGVIETKLVDDIIIGLYQNSISNITEIIDSSQINNFSNFLDCLIERVFQITLSRMSGNNKFDVPAILLDDTIKLQDLQLWYSILIQSKDQMHNVLSKSDHLLMTLLRITLFTEYESINTTLTSDLTPDTQSEKDSQLKKKNKNKKIINNEINKINLNEWKLFVDKSSFNGLMLDLAFNSILNINKKTSILLIDEHKKNTYPRKCVIDFLEHVKSYFNINEELTAEYVKNIQSLYKRSVEDNIKTKNDMYESIKDNSILRDIEDAFDAKIDKDKISKL